MQKAIHVSFYSNSQVVDIINRYLEMGYKYIDFVVTCNDVCGVLIVEDNNV